VDDNRWTGYTYLYICIDYVYDNVYTMCTLHVYYRHHLGRYVPGSVYIGFGVALLLPHSEILDDNRWGRFPCLCTCIECVYSVCVLPYIIIRVGLCPDCYVYYPGLGVLKKSIRIKETSIPVILKNLEKNQPVVLWPFT
jgi:hypothetical protein